MNYNKINLPSSKKTAVLFLVFNRPDTTIKVFENKTFETLCGG